MERKMDELAGFNQLLDSNIQNVHKEQYASATTGCFSETNLSP